MIFLERQDTILFYQLYIHIYDKRENEEDKGAVNQWGL